MRYDLVVIGGGAMGLSTAYHAAREKLHTLVIEQFPLFNERMSSGGATRQFRVQYAEDYMARLTLSSIPFWDELQAHSRVPLRSRVGSVWFGDPNVAASEGQIQGAMATLKELKIPFETLDVQGIEHFGFANVPPGYVGLFQADGGTINVAATLQSLHAEAVASGFVTFMSSERVVALTAHEDGVLVRTSTETIDAPKVVIAAGPGSNDMLRFLGIELDITIWQMASCYFRKRHADVDFPSWFVFEPEAAHYDPGAYYGFEEVDYACPGFVRVAPAFALQTFRDPAEATERPDPMDLLLTSRFVAAHMPGLDPEPRFPSRCLIGLPADPDRKMFLDLAPASVPGHRNIAISAAGWQFKFVPLVGKVCVDLVMRGRTDIDISHFGISPAVPAVSAAVIPMAVPGTPLRALPAKRHSRRRIPF